MSIRIVRRKRTVLKPWVEGTLAALALLALMAFAGTGDYNLQKDIKAMNQCAAGIGPCDDGD